MPSSSASALLSQLIDDYIGWFAAWHWLTGAPGRERKGLLTALEPPPSFKAWRAQAASPLMPQNQPALEKLNALQDQLHTHVRLVVMNTPEDQPIPRKDDEDLIARYREFMKALRHLEHAFAAAASDLDPLTGLRPRP